MIMASILLNFFALLKRVLKRQLIFNYRFLFPPHERHFNRPLSRALSFSFGSFHSFSNWSYHCFFHSIHPAIIPTKYFENDDLEIDSKFIDNAFKTLYVL